MTAGHAPADGVALVDARIAAMPEPQRTTLSRLRETLRTVLPRAEEGLKYGMPCFVVQGKGVAGYDAFKDHCSYFPMSGGVLQRIPNLPAGTAATKGTLQFPVDAPLPVSFVKLLVRARLDEISEVTKGPCIELYDDGGLKAKGSMQQGLRHGTWRFYSRDGEVLRTARYRAGAEVS